MAAVFGGLLELGIELGSPSLVESFTLHSLGVGKTTGLKGLLLPKHAHLAEGFHSLVGRFLRSERRGLTWLDGSTGKIRLVLTKSLLESLLLCKLPFSRNDLLSYFMGVLCVGKIESLRALQIELPLMIASHILLICVVEFRDLG